LKIAKTTLICSTNKQKKNKQKQTNKHSLAVLVTLVRELENGTQKRGYSWILHQSLLLVSGWESEHQVCYGFFA